MWWSSSKLACALLLSACVSAAPDLPTAAKPSLAEFDAADKALSCDAIATQTAEINRQLAAIDARVDANRVRNEMLVYFGGAIVPLFATESNNAEKAQVPILQNRKDVLMRLATVRGCSTSPKPLPN